jgi:hypothetical protein
MFRSLGVIKVRSPEKHLITLDHCVPAANTAHAANHKVVREFVREMDIGNFHDMNRGICHQVHAEEGFALPGTLIGAMLGTQLTGIWFNRVLAGVMVAVLLLTFRARKRSAAATADPQSQPPSPRRLVAAHVLMLAAGFYGGFIQAGVGFILIAILHSTLGLDLVRVNMHKVFIIGVYTVVAVAVFAWQGHVDWAIGLLLAAGNALGAWLGTHVAVRQGDRVVRVVLNIALAAMAVKLLFG